MPLEHITASQKAVFKKEFDLSGEEWIVPNGYAYSVHFNFTNNMDQKYNNIFSNAGLDNFRQVILKILYIFTYYTVVLFSSLEIRVCNVSVYIVLQLDLVFTQLSA